MTKIVLLIVLFFSTSLLADSLIFGGVQYHSGSDSKIERKYSMNHGYYKELSTPETIHSVNFKDKIFNNDIITTTESFLKIRFGWEGYLILYPYSQLEISSNTHEKTLYTSELTLEYGTIRIINIPDNRGKIQLSLVSDDITLANIMGELIVSTKENSVSVHNLKLTNRYQTSSLTSPTNISEGYSIVFSSDSKPEPTQLSQKAITDLNLEFIPPAESYYKGVNPLKGEKVPFDDFVEPKMIQTRRNAISLGVAFTWNKYSTSGYNAEKFPTTGSGGVFKYARLLKQSYKLGISLTTGDLANKSDDPKVDKTSFQHNDLFGSIYLLDSFWATIGFGYSTYNFKCLNSNTPYNVTQSGANFMMAVEKEWEFYGNFFLAANISGRYMSLKTRKTEYAIPSPFPGKINVTSFDFSGLIGYNF